MVVPKYSRDMGFETTSLRPRFYDCAQQGPLSQRRAISMLDSGREYLATSMVTMKKMRSRTFSTLRRKVCSLHVTVVSVFGHLKFTHLDEIGIDSVVQRI
ncbi:hypothetical protein DTO217A2_4375 [Paecilomyces variotii]|nr:hypothetical protein DTO217A2_4375 [Paecilomyces variotii]KAJ9353890.1 hypothetical protein DTO027B9_5103 [Paecilomyces variotii]KAJ9394138.1 hypothetical protein DTO282F9_8947 [Paecilomyces variotii]